MVDLTRKYDVLVIGGGNAALCAAISARRAGASVLVLEGRPVLSGRNTRIPQYALRPRRRDRHSHRPYTEQEFWKTCCV